ncbi:LysR family transcriptional regulator, partial [Achromobacter ruhlandii]|uniref:LysR family transcriptional regulator n=1 Tax=Achromobacter ruhlandii TaxID=72557 RepID=UPI002016496F
MLNYRHLYYFWMVAKEGGFSRAAERLDMAIQTISAQVRELEKNLGHQLLRPAGRGVALTDAGQAAFARAEEIFQIGQELPQEVRAAATKPVIRLSVGLSDGISKLAAHALLGPVLDTPDLRLTCHEGEVEELPGGLARPHPALVLAGPGAPVAAPPPRHAAAVADAADHDGLRPDIPHAFPRRGHALAVAAAVPGAPAHPGRPFQPPRHRRTVGRGAPRRPLDGVAGAPASWTHSRAAARPRGA